MKRTPTRRGLRSVVTAILATLGLLAGASAAHASTCYSVNVGYYNQTTPSGTACNFNYQHGNVYAVAYSKVQRLSAPPGYPYYCDQAATRIVYTGYATGSTGFSSTSWAQSSSPIYNNIIFSTMYAYSGGTAYFADDKTVFC